ncbi:hypothetical protein AJ80_00334 [Polytolypa hystricis UAMH7299]|uniref:Cytochrome b5 heme-binding domain-containing protein n=1 Tax=Polytolypa hystricis (strain UAMH7299) TaxID=1447883 RepID=A0A2B7Z5F5_POLH7|nr:hypothetical protein AJ80_00334 [Polytolypa hystricis UAMH7299]
MGWLGLGVLIASVSFLCYKHPPFFWRFEALFRRAGASRRIITTSESQASTPAKGIEEKSERLRVEEPTTLTVECKQDDRQSPSEAGYEGSESAQSTPKTNPIAAIPTLNIPILKLENDTDTSKQKENAPSISFGNAPSSSTPFSPPTPVSVAPVPAASSANGKPNQSTLMAPPPLPAKPRNQPLSNARSLSSMPPPPRPLSSTPLRPPPSAASTLRTPPSRGLSSSTLSPMGLTSKPAKPSRQVMLEPGHSPLDWAALTANPSHNLRGANLPSHLIRVPPSLLKQYTGRKGRDAWTSYMGKVYNITPYLPFHPGGNGELLRGAGKDSEKLFKEIHPWVNWDGMLGECLVGILVGEHDAAAFDADGGGGGGLDDMD